MSDTSNASAQSSPAGKRFPVTKIVVLVAVAAIVAILRWQFGDLISYEAIAEQESELRRYRDANPASTYTLAFVVYVVVTGLSLPGATILTLVYAWFFGFGRGLVLISFASTSGASIAFLLSRYLFRESLESKFGDRLQKFNESLEREGAFYLFTMRLIPAFPFFIINVVMGLTPLRLRTYWWVSQLGMFPGTAIYVWTGSRVPDLETLSREGSSGILSWELLAAFVLLGAFPITVKKLMERVRKLDSHSQ